MLFHLISRLVSASAGFAYPAYASYKAIKANHTQMMEMWLMYWVTMGCVLAFESTVEWTFNWFPFYYEFKTLVILWLTLPQIQGSTYLYVAHIEPFLTLHESEIDRAIADTKVKAKQVGLEWLNKTIKRVRAALLGGGITEAFGDAPPPGGTLPAQSMQHPPTMSDPASMATSGLYSLAGNVFRQYGPAAVAAGSLLLQPMAGRITTTRSATSKPDVARSSATETPTTSKLTKTSRRAQLEAELAALDATSTFSSPSSYSTASTASSPPNLPRVPSRTVSGANPASLVPTERSRTSSSNSSSQEGKNEKERFEKIGKDELEGNDARPSTPGGTVRRGSWWWNKDAGEESIKPKEA